MIDLHDLTSDDCSDDIGSNTSSSTLDKFFIIDRSPSTSTPKKYDAATIKRLLKQCPDKYVLADNNRSIQPSGNKTPSPPRKKKFRSYTAQFEDDDDCAALNSVANSTHACRELESYLQLKISNSTNADDDHDDPLQFWNDQERLFPNLFTLAKKILCIPASSAPVERNFSSAGVIISQRRSSINPALVNDITFLRSADAYFKSQT